MNVEATEQSRAADDAEASYEAFVAARSASLYRTAFLLTGQDADAEDLLQVVLIKLYVAWGKARRARSVDAYARTVMTHAFISSRRPARFTRERVVEALPERQAGTAEPDTRLALWPQVVALPLRQRAVVVLRYYEDLSEAEIAEALGCSVGTVKSTAHAALRSLRGRLGEGEL